MGKGAKLISFPLLPQAWQMKKSTWLSSSRARAQMSRSPQLLPRSQCQLSLLTPWSIVSATLRNTCSQLLSAVTPAAIHRFACHILDFSSADDMLFVRIRHQMVLWMHLVVVDACDKIMLQKENEIQMITVYKCHPYQPVTPLDLKVESQCKLDSDTL